MNRRELLKRGRLPLAQAALAGAASAQRRLAGAQRHHDRAVPAGGQPISRAGDRGGGAGEILGKSVMSTTAPAARGSIGNAAGRTARKRTATLC